METFNSENSACFLGGMSSVGNAGRRKFKIKAVRDKLHVSRKYAGCVPRFSKNGYRMFTLRE